MTYGLIAVVLVVLVMTLYVDFEISFTRNENGSFNFRFEIGMKKS